MTTEERVEPEFIRVFNDAGLQIVLKLLVERLDHLSFKLDYPEVYGLIAEAEEKYRNRHGTED